ncbi:aminotransferase class IV [Frigidibacter oleivorans]|uniref:aminotransferase class IV n=1 Tax=Frigidibacter oleivorans TaxID=2487129 RepID=UPI001F28BC87|nr:aminotransferase class IV [Frigidibacter oleivorans]
MEDPFRDARLIPGLQLIETLAWDGTRLPRRDRHLARLAAGAATLGFPCDPAAAAALLGGVAGDASLRLRLTLDAAGRFDLTAAPLPPAPAEWRVALAAEPLASSPWLGVKTTMRARYDRDRAALPPGIEEWIYANPAGEVCEGTITNLFFDRGEGLRTPPLACGLLPGCLRAELLETGAAREEVLRAGDLPRVRLWMGNSLRGLIPARLVSAAPPASSG